MLRAGLVSKKEFVSTIVRFLLRAVCATLVCAMVCPVLSWAQGPWQQVQELTASGQATTNGFGGVVAVSSDGSTMVVGTPGVGAFVFINNGTTWTQQQELTVPADAAGYAFGASVAVNSNGSTIVVGAYDPQICQPDGGCTGGNPGKTYVFVRSGTTWTQQEELTASDGAMLDAFGVSVAVGANGGTVIIGAPGAGKVYVFLGNGSTWTQQQELTASDTRGAFGTLVAVSGDGGTVLISDNLGKVYVFVNSGGTWVQQQELTVSDGSLFGESLVVNNNGSIVVSGANPSDLGNNPEKGKAYVFVGNGTTWTQQQELTAFDGTGGEGCCVGDDGFGESVSISSDGSVLLLGAPNATTVGSNLGQGKAYIFVGNGTTWTQQQELIDSNGALGDGFGSAVSISGNGATASVGEPGFNAGQGAVYVFNAIAGSSATTTTVLTTSANPSISGQSVTFTADVIGYSPTGTVTFTDNGSNLATVPVVNWLATYTTAYSTAGAHAITAAYSGDKNNQPSTSAGLIQDVDMPWSQLQDLTASDPALTALFGYSVAISGNTAVVGAPGWGPVQLPQDGQGAAYVFVQNGGTWTQQAELTAPDGYANDDFGLSVAVSGNIAVVGAPYHEVSTYGAVGAAYVFVQSGGTWTLQAELTPPVAAGVQNFYSGWSVAISGNTIVVGAPYTYTSSGEGVVYVYVQNGGTWTLQAELPAPGYSVAISGNTIVVGAQGGPAYVYAQSGGTWSQQAALIDSDGADDDFGYSVAIDGSTAVVGARQYRADSNSYQGVAYAFVQSGGTWTQQAALTAPDAQGSDQYGDSVAISGSTAVMGVPLPTNQQGTAYAFTQGGGTWGQPAALIASDLATATYDRFGWSVAISGNMALGGGPYANQGAVYVFAPPVVTFSASPQQPLTTDGSGNYIAQVTITNTGNVTVSSIQISSATLGSGSLLSTPAAITNLAPGASAAVTLTFPANSVPAGASTASLKVNGTYSVNSPALGGNWALSFRSVTL